MKYNQHFFVVICALIAMVPCSPMEGDNQLQTNNKKHWLNNSQEIMTVKNPLSVQCVRYGSENQLLVLDCWGDLCKVNLRTKNIEQRFPVYRVGNLKLQGNDKKIMIGSSHNLFIYEKKPAIKEYSRKWGEYLQGGIQDFAWDEVNNTVFVCDRVKNNEIRKYNYETNIFELISLGDQKCQKMAIHSEKKVMCITDFSGNISFYDAGDPFLNIKNIQFDPEMKQCWFCRYSLDGSCIVVGNDKKIIIVDFNKTIDKFSSLNAQKYETFRAIALHPHGSILAILFCRPYRIHGVRYWNLKTQDIIEETPRLNFERSYDFDFSADGLEVAIALENKCVRAYVCFLIQDKCIYALCVLNKIKEQMEKEVDLPQDIVRCIGNTFLELLRKF